LEKCPRDCECVIGWFDLWLDRFVFYQRHWLLFVCSNLPELQQRQGLLSTAANSFSRRADDFILQVFSSHLWSWMERRLMKTSKFMLSVLLIVQSLFHSIITLVSK
jgi:hypothetical protein